MKKVTITAYDESRGFSIKNLGGYTLSVGVGKSHYCENQIDEGHQVCWMCNEEAIPHKFPKEKVV